jgi:hypothetical protein
LKGFFIIEAFDLDTEMAHGDCNDMGSFKGLRCFLMGFSLAVDATDAS